MTKAPMDRVNNETDRQICFQKAAEKTAAMRNGRKESIKSPGGGRKMAAGARRLPHHCGLNSVNSEWRNIYETHNK
jgi:hypothetical protein